MARKKPGIRVKPGPVIARRILTIVVPLLALGGLLGRSVQHLFSDAPATAGGVEALFEQKRSDVVVEVEGVVKRALRDDKKGRRHQRFIMALSSGHTVLVAHNIDLAPRVDGLMIGDHVGVRGEYEWNAKGGVLHWTHHDPGGRRPGGWIEHKGRRYR